MPKVLADQPFSAASAKRKLAVADATCARVAEERERHYVAQLHDRYGDALATYFRIYAEKDYPSAKGYLCLGPGERWADLLTDNYFANTGEVVNDRIRSHRWVTASECGLGNWLT
ncbi:hypothetical protein [Streptomyces griseorubiginosus]|uniref:Uncharacterized protein n=1 Tax=Streptomyces griseorubiginosus TaxID=67304 RepID=A0AAI8PS09_9ACTN|nr:hypothetical protein [Streptomyces griseorubiginosus]AYC44103.1 hypothetical protein DWG14_08411 [Streptomyces griseorubiginosus]